MQTKDCPEITKRWGNRALCLQFASVKVSGSLVQRLGMVYTRMEKYREKSKKDEHKTCREVANDVPTVTSTWCSNCDR